jgi:hypothetical protein
VFTIGVSLHVPAPGLLANDAGIAGTIVDVSSSGSTSLNNATVALHPDGSFTYTPDPTDPIAGDDSFSYQIQDPQGGTDSATVNVEVDAVVRDDSYSTPSNTTLSIRAPGIFANDVGIDTSSVIADDSSIRGAAVTVNDDGSLLYQPPHGFSGADTFTYTVSDTNDDNDYTATVHVGVGIAAPPVSSTPNPKNTGTPSSGTPPGNLTAHPTTPSSSSPPSTQTSARTPTGLPGVTAPRTPSGASGVAAPRSTSTSATAPAGPTGSRQAVSVHLRHRRGSAILVAAAVAVAILAAATGALWWRRRHNTPAGNGASASETPRTDTPHA